MAIPLGELGIDRLSVRERLDLIERIWDSLPEAVAPDEVPEWHKELLAERLAEADANPGGGVPWRDALAAIRWSVSADVSRPQHSFDSGAHL